MPNQYTYTALNVVGGNTTASGLNSAGDIVEADNNNGVYEAFLYTDGTYTFLSDPHAGPLGTVGTGINNSGEIVGDFYTPNTSLVQGFLYSGGTYTTLNEPLGVLGTQATGINNAGEVVGAYFTANGTGHGFFYYAGAFTLLPDAPTSITTVPLGINNEGQIVGTYFGSNDINHGFLYSNGKYTTIDDPLGVMGDEACGINSSGEIVGTYMDANGQSHGFVYSNGTYTTLNDPAGMPPYVTAAMGINDLGEIVGWYGDSAEVQYAFQATPLPAVESDTAHVYSGHTVAENATNGVLANDVDPTPADALSVSAVNGQALNVGQAVNGRFGTLTLDADGSYSYAADGQRPLPADGVGEDTFQYTAEDEAGGSATTTLTFFVVRQGIKYLVDAAGDTIHGGWGYSVLDGSAGDDTLVAGHGNQVLIGASGDTLAAGSGYDTFVFLSSFGENTIEHFRPLLDKIQLPASEFANFAAVQDRMHQVGANTVVQLDASDVITLIGVNAASLHALNFHFV